MSELYCPTNFWATVVSLKYTEFQKGSSGHFARLVTQSNGRELVYRFAIRNRIGGAEAPASRARPLMCPVSLGELFRLIGNRGVEPLFRLFGKMGVEQLSQLFGNRGVEQLLRTFGNNWGQLFYTGAFSVAAGLFCRCGTTAANAADWGCHNGRSVSNSARKSSAHG